MLIPNISGNVHHATQPPRHISDTVPVLVASKHSNAEITIAPGTAADLPKVAVRQVAEQQATTAQLQSAIESINKALQQSNKNLEFSIDKETEKRVVKLVDTDTGDVIRQFPSEEAIAISKAIAQMQQGMLLKQKA